jgi:hypothetical protein
MVCGSGCKQFGGASGAPLSYVDPKYTGPSASAGSNLLISEPLLARPSLNHTGGKRGGFFPPPSIMGSFIPNAARLAPAAAITGYRMVRNYKKTRKRKAKLTRRAKASKTRKL